MSDIDDKRAVDNERTALPAPTEKPGDRMPGGWDDGATDAEATGNEGASEQPARQDQAPDNPPPSPAPPVIESASASTACQTSRSKKPYVIVGAALGVVAALALALAGLVFVGVGTAVEHESAAVSPVPDGMHGYEDWDDDWDDWSGASSRDGVLSTDDVATYRFEFLGEHAADYLDADERARYREEVLVPLDGLCDVHDTRVEGIEDILSQLHAGSLSAGEASDALLELADGTLARLEELRGAPSTYTAWQAEEYGAAHDALASFWSTDVPELSDLVANPQDYTRRDLERFDEASEDRVGNAEDHLEAIAENDLHRSHT